MNSSDTQILSPSPLSSKQTYNIQLETKDLSKQPEAGHEVLLLIGDRIERLLMHPDLEYQLGRFEVPQRHQVSLNRYDAMKHGISRLHASLSIRDNKLHIRDCGSTNGTYIGGQRLLPDKPVELEKGSQVLLGRLHLLILFE